MGAPAPTHLLTRCEMYGEATSLPGNGAEGTWEQGKTVIPCDASPRNRGWGLCCQAEVSTPGRSYPSWMSVEN